MPAPKLIDPIKLVDWSFVKGLEGNKRTGYVPRDPDKGKQAGVTIGAGVDLGQMSPRDLKNLGLPKELESKLTPYVSLVGDAAKSTLKKKPLSLSEIEAAQVTDARKRFGVNRLGSKLATAGVDFSTLPPEVATAVTSLGWHLGEDLPNAAPRFTEKLAKAQKTGDFAPVVLELRNFGKDHKYMTRRKKEADLIESFIKKNKT